MAFTSAAGSHDPGSSEEGRNTRRRLDTFSNPDDENARSAVRRRFPCEQCHAGESAWVSGFLAKQVPHLLDSYLAREPSANNLLHHTGMKASHTLLTVLSITPVPQFWFVIPNHQKTEKSEDVLHFSGRFWPESRCRGP